jgi:hypothetical protein
MLTVLLSNECHRLIVKVFRASGTVYIFFLAILNC